MRSAAVREAWEFYRDNCPGFKEPMRKEFRRLDEYVDSLESENAKLRELVSGIGHLLFSLDVDYCAACPRDGINHSCPVYTVDGGECLYKTDLRELGVEE